MATTATAVLEHNNTIEHTPSGADVNPGDVVVAGSRVCVARNKIADGATGDLSIKGRYSFPAKSDDVIAQGVDVYWDADPGEITTTASGNTLAGKSANASPDGTTTIEVDLND